MALTIAIIITGISISLLVIYGADVVSGEAGQGFLPLDAMARGIGLGTPPIILSIIAFFISRKEPSKRLGVMMIITGILVIIGGAISLSSTAEPDNVARSAGGAESIIAIGGFIAVLGGIKLKKS